MLILGRAVAGMGSSGIMNGGLTIVSSLVPLNRSPALIGMLMGCEYFLKHLLYISVR